jgi:hypothetical protein
VVNLGKYLVAQTLFEVVAEYVRDDFLCYRIFQDGFLDYGLMEVGFPGLVVGVP